MPQLVFSCRPTGIHSLPIELLSAIFILGFAFEDPYADSPFLLKPDQEYKPIPSSNFEVVVSHVSHHWRQVALSTQSLWTTFHFRNPTHLSRAKAYLARCSTSTTSLLDVLVDTVSVENHVPGVTLYKDELYSIFQVIIPHIRRWRTFHLKVSDNECKGVARLFLGTCGGAQNLETLQLYHFEDYRTSQGLYLATYRPPVVIFGNNLPRLKNISLIGVNLPWENSPYIANLHNLELALHSESVRPVYSWWDSMLRSSTELKSLCLYYSGPSLPTSDPARAWSTPGNKIRLEKLRELNVTDLDSEYLCDLVERLCLPNLKRLTLELPEQDYSPFMDLITGPSLQKPANDSTQAQTTSEPNAARPAPIAPLPSVFNLEILVIKALECSWTSWAGFLQATQGLRVLEVDFARVGPAFWNVFTQPSTPKSQTHIGRGISIKPLLLPRLQMFKLTGVSGEDIVSALRYRYSLRREFTPKKQKWVVGWSERRRNRDGVLDTLIRRGFWMSDDEDAPDAAKVIIDNYEDFDDPGDEEDDLDEDEDDYDGDGDFLVE
ncbi:hypothetical protein GALMADRAFT_1347475 [Galerina marginata CBS 339.88]|uniref:Uncharacterized protein n=1 Tax=Galerina marginata (strain CBS 339.88) TaxID=685588 RepID=A0A067TJT0_GALM3|nr:hypothetical protein GALMADRAFT_1347475 [Galerina marginata CBS 339.88]